MQKCRLKTDVKVKNKARNKNVEEKQKKYGELGKKKDRKEARNYERE